MKIKITEEQLKTLTENVKNQNINEGFFDFLKNAYESIKNLIKKFKDGDMSKSDFTKELKKMKDSKSSTDDSDDSDYGDEIPKGKGYKINGDNGFHSKSRPTHGGIDYNGSTGDFIVIKKPGTIIKTSTTCSVGDKKCGGGCGNYVKIKHEDGNTTMYCHISNVNVKKNSKVDVGDVIGTIGNTGRSQGPHLHYQFWNGSKLSNGKSTAQNYFVILNKSDQYGKSRV